LKQARQRASRLFLNDGARSSLPQYRQTSFSALAAERDARGRPLLLAEVAAVFGCVARGLVFAFMWFSFSGRGFGATGRREHTLLWSADMGRRPA
jgi:hypothetical protein